MSRGAARNPLPEGTLSVGAGLVVAGITAYGFLVISARALGPERYAGVSVLWALVYLAAPGFFFPLEQEVSRALAARRAKGEGGAPVVRRAAVAGGGLALLLVAGCVLAARPLVDRLFDGDGFLLLAFIISLVGYGATHLARGTLSGTGRFGAYGLVVGSDGVVRLAGCAVLALAGVATAGPYGVVMGLAPFVAVAIGLAGRRGLLEPGPEASWTELSSALGYLLAGSVLAQILVNAGPIAVKVLATQAEKAEAGRFLAGLIIARVPLFMFQAVQAALLPRLSGFAAAGRHADFRSGLKRLLVVVLVIGAVATAGALAIGPWVVRFLFGPAFDLSRRDLGYLAAASGAYMVAVTLAQSLIALSGHVRVPMGWFAGVVALVVVTALGSDLLLRVEQGFLAGSIAAAVAMGLLLLSPLKAGRTAEPEQLIEAAGKVPIEP